MATAGGGDVPAKAAYDAVVVGVGGMGSATTYELARRGHDVLALERFNIPHGQGSSHGYSRTVGRAFYEREELVALYDRALDLWEGIEAAWGGQVLYRKGSLTTGRPGTEILERATRTADRFDVPHERLTAAETNERFPGYRIPAEHDVLYQRPDGFLVPRDGVRACVDLAHRHGAEIHARTPVEGWEPTADGGVRVRTDDGEVEADSLLVTAGAWTPALLDVTRDVLEAERQVLGRFQPDEPDLFGPDPFPVATMTTENGQYSTYPAHGAPGVKIVRFNHLEEVVDPDEVGMAVTDADEAVLRWLGDRYLAGGAGPTMRLETCLYTNTPDEDFILDSHPEHPQVRFAAGFSGHGYKFCPVVGEVLADLTERGETDHDVDPFRFERF